MLCHLCHGMILLLAMFVGAGLVLSGCGDDDTATTPAPAPPPPAPEPEPEPEPEPAPEPPATPSGLMVSATTIDSITWTWNAVEGAIGYAVQVSADEMFDETDTIHPAADATFTASPLPPETSVYIRVAAAGGTLEAPILSGWTTHVTGMSAMPPPPPLAPEPPGSPTGLMVSETTQTSITWTWNAVDGATGYAVQVSSDEMFDDMDTTHNTEETTYTASDLDPETSVYLRVAATAGTEDAPLMSGWTTHATGMSAMPPPPPAPDPLGEPTGLAMSASNGGSITWSWDAVDNADGYQVQFNTVPTFADVDPVHTADTSHTQTGLSEGMTGHLRVRATAGSGDMMRAGSWAAHVSGSTRVTPAIPMNLSAAPGEGSITWTWDATENADSYLIQYSAGGAFTAGTESLEVAENSYTKDGLETGATAYLRVRASGGTDDQERLMGGWTDPTRGMSATPVIPPAPAGLTATSGDGSITWSWDEVAGATGYQVQVSTSEDFSGAETTDVEGTSHAVDVDAGATAYLRVRATGTGDAGAWSTHATGMSNAPEPEPEPTPDPIVVTFSVGEDDGDAMVADDGTDKEKATAAVNPKMVVSSNYTAAITPMFVEDAAAVTVAAGDNNVPFSYVDWDALQSEVVDGGVTFMIQKTAMGANQEMEPTGDVAYVTCGPFDCVSGDTAPEITIMDDESCEMWDPVLDVQYGYVDNDVIGEDGAVTDDGIELGWVTSSTLAMGVKHTFTGVDTGTQTVSFSISGLGAAKGDDRPLKMTREDDSDTTDDEEISLDPTNTDGYIYRNALVACAFEHGVPSGNTVGGLMIPLLQPDECFKIGVDPDWLAGYGVEFTPENDGITWGEIDWFEDLECESMTSMASDTATNTDICELFDDEVTHALSEDWSAVAFNIAGTAEAAHLDQWSFGRADDAPDARQFKTLWFDDDGDMKLTTEEPDAGERHTMRGLGKLNDLYAEAGADPESENVTMIWRTMVDEDDDPTSNFGKVDLHDNDDETDGDDEGGPNNTADNMTDAQEDVAKCGDDGCDATIEMDVEILFGSGTYGCTTTRTVAVSCTWDAQGNVNDEDESPTPLDDTFGGLTDTNIENFVKCEEIE